MGLRIAIIGYGKMGRSIERLAPEHDCEVAQIVRSAENPNAAALNRICSLGLTSLSNSPRPWLRHKI